MHDPAKRRRAAAFVIVKVRVRLHQNFIVTALGLLLWHYV